MTEIKVLYDKIFSDGIQKPPKVFIDIYEENKNLIEGADHSISNPDYDGIMRITAEYALSLSSYGSSAKSIPYLDKAIQLFKNSPQTDLSKVQMYEVLVWARGIENYNQKKYSLAAKDFQYLVYNYPDNDKYKNWLLASKTIRAKKYLNYIWGLALISFIGYFLAKKDGDRNRDIFFIATYILILTGTIVEIAIWAVKSSIKSNERTT